VPVKGQKNAGRRVRRRPARRPRSKRCRPLQLSISRMIRVARGAQTGELG
jgi:hypothetical protein